MANIHIVEPGGQPTVYSEEQARMLWEQGQIPAHAYYWKEGMSQWELASTLFGAPPATADAPALRNSSPDRPLLARNPEGLSRFLTVMLWISLGTAFTGVLLTVISLATGNAVKGNAAGSSALEGVEVIVAFFQTVVFVTTGVPFLMWIHLANRNARALGAQGMEFTPGWSVGWYFIPFLNLWKPYQAMKEIWQATQNPRSWRSAAVPSFLSHWWGLWILTGLLGQMSYRFSMHAQTKSDLIWAATADLLSDLSDIALCLVAMHLVAAICRKQLEWAKGDPKSWTSAPT